GGPAPWHPLGFVQRVALRTFATARVSGHRPPVQHLRGPRKAKRPGDGAPFRRRLLLGGPAGRLRGRSALLTCRPPAPAPGRPRLPATGAKVNSGGRGWALSGQAQDVYRAVAIRGGDVAAVGGKSYRGDFPRHSQGVEPLACADVPQHDAL